MRRDGFITCVQLLHALVHADEQVTREETDFIERVMAHMRFSEEERAAAGERVDMEAARAMLSGLSRPVREGLLRTLARAAMADGHVDAREEGFIASLCEAIGLDEATAAKLWRAP